MKEKMNLCCVLKLNENKIFFYLLNQRVSSDIGKPFGYFQTAKSFKFDFAKQEHQPYQ